MSDRQETFDLAALPAGQALAAMPGSASGSLRVRTYRWGESYAMVDGKMVQTFEGVTETLVHPFAGGTGPTKRIGDGEYSCFGCPFFGLSESGRANCAHPTYLRRHGCPQYIRGLRTTWRDCPSLWEATPAGIRTTRVKEKWNGIFWGYFADKNPYREGFRGLTEVVSNRRKKQNDKIQP